MKFDKRKKYIAAVSGGPDSMALLDKYHKNIIGVCHVNYHKRADSYRDTEIVAEYCHKKRIKLFILHVHQQQYKKSQIHNFQALARKIRYDFFVKCSKKTKCENILLGHNLNDFLETAIMQQNQKSLNFYYGIREVSSYQNLKIYRPLIDKFKKDLEEYCEQNGIAYAIDSTNSLDIYKRNQIRKQLTKKTNKYLLDLYKKIKLRNKKFEKFEKQASLDLTKWKKTNYSLKFIKKNQTDNLIYLFLKENCIETINRNKILLIKNFLMSQKSNCSIRLQEGKILYKSLGTVRIKNSTKMY